ncbi:hypothetical protein GCM10015535_51620 [Streptomyces gelaticus]|uniref:Uncharacterized protein n=1 Tax=Streptomyces gelaticus TaxID=285446 RepID=A0ABQ2W743_9ACTN|nr:hypothetical protein GCM10015535_51620 [Streptomyces gelaticus]
MRRTAARVLPVSGAAIGPLPTVWRHGTVPAHRPEVVPMAAPATSLPAPSNLKRIVAASLIGTTIEWYDNSSDQSCDLLFSRH